jgi:NADH-quinone oxidoreductase subunit E
MSPDIVDKIEELKSKYPSPRALVLPSLWMIQYEDGYISLDAIDEISELIDTPPMEIYRVATFYTMFNLEPVGRYHIQICKTLSCSLRGKSEVLKRVAEMLDIGVGETTSDGKYTLSQVECLGSCGTAPVMQINDIYHENLTPEKAEEIVDSLEKESI